MSAPIGGGIAENMQMKLDAEKRSGFWNFDLGWLKLVAREVIEMGNVRF